MVAIVTMIKNEQKYLQEWIEWHLQLGVDVIHIYEDLDSTSHKSITDKFNKVFLHNVHECYNGGELIRRNIQVKLYNYFICNFKYDYDWCAFIDVDEFIIGDLNILAKYSDKKGILIQWKVFNANGYINSPKGKLMDIYTRECPCLGRDSANWDHKSIVNLRLDPLMQDCHTVVEGVKCSELVINHYMTKSFEDFCWRVFERGDVYHRVYRQLEDFYELNPDIDRDICEQYIIEHYGENPEAYVQESEYYPEQKVYNVSKNIIKITNKIHNNDKEVHNIETIQGTCKITDPKKIVSAWKYNGDVFMYKLYSNIYNTDTQCQVEITDQEGNTHLITITQNKSDKLRPKIIQLSTSKYITDTYKSILYIPYMAPRCCGKLSYDDPSNIYNITFLGVELEIQAEEVPQFCEHTIRIYGELGGETYLTIKRINNN